LKKGARNHDAVFFIRALSVRFFWNEAQTFFPYLTITTIIYRERRTCTEESSGCPLMQRSEILSMNV
jgi:hypothetical protein